MVDTLHFRSPTPIANKLVDYSHQMLLFLISFHLWFVWGWSRYWFGLRIAIESVTWDANNVTSLPLIFNICSVLFDSCSLLFRAAEVEAFACRFNHHRPPSWWRFLASTTCSWEYTKNMKKIMNLRLLLRKQTEKSWGPLDLLECCLSEVVRRNTWQLFL